jgi:hypothetical protein
MVDYSTHARALGMYAANLRRSRWVWWASYTCVINWIICLGNRKRRFRISFPRERWLSRLLKLELKVWQVIKCTIYKTEFPAGLRSSSTTGRGDYKPRVKRRWAALLVLYLWIFYRWGKNPWKHSDFKLGLGKMGFSPCRAVGTRSRLSISFSLSNPHR